MAGFQTLLGCGTRHKSTSNKEMRTRQTVPSRPDQTHPNIRGLLKQPDKHETTKVADRMQALRRLCRVVHLWRSLTVSVSSAIYRRLSSSGFTIFS